MLFLSCVRLNHNLIRTRLRTPLGGYSRMGKDSDLYYMMCQSECIFSIVVNKYNTQPVHLSPHTAHLIRVTSAFRQFSNQPIM